MSNRLANETSPYLLQHADNPVDWHPWDERALSLARESGRPILLSIGYSACHWCHVMAHESFEDPATATLMNQLYINIKVDREERPDIDRIYQLAHHLFTGRSGGWPLTAFLTPDRHLPIMVGTYFPKEPQYGMPSFAEVLARVAEYHHQHPQEITRQGDAFVSALQRIDGADASTRGGSRDRSLLEGARTAMTRSFDARHGGFGSAPKFPHPTGLELALDLRQDALTSGNDDQTLHNLLTRTLDAMATGGLCDQLGGGFFRYCVDEAWTIPHFEKMLYDNASLLALYADAWTALGDPFHASVAIETADWLNRDMRSPDGAWYAALDADSDGAEGTFYLWTPEQFDQALDPAQAQVAKSVFGLYRDANFEQQWHLHLAERPATVAAANNLETAEVERLLQAAKSRLRHERNARVWPGRDEKLIVSWNALTIRAMARAARRLQRPDLASHAMQATDFIRTRLWDGARLLSVFKDGQARFPAYLDDHAFLADALVELLQSQWRTEDLHFATALIDRLLEGFADTRGGFYFVASDHERLIHRPRSFADEAVPSGNGVATRVLIALGHLLGQVRYLEAAEKALDASGELMARHPDAHASMLRALALAIEPPELVVVRGTETRLDPWRRMLTGGYHPRRFAFCIPAEAGELPGLLAERRPLDSGDPVAYLCTGTQCRAPITSLEELAAALAAPGH